MFLWGSLIFAVSLLGCSEESVDTEAVSSTHSIALPFAVRGTLGSLREILVHVDHEIGPLSRGTVVGCTLEACRRWEGASPVKFKLTDDVKSASLIIGWRSTEHGECRPFIPWTGEFAHTTAMGPIVSIHLSRDSKWSERGGESGQGLFQTLLHEMGHVLGLDHTMDIRTLMYPAYDVARNTITGGESAGMIALYGGVTQQAGSLLIERDGQAVAGPLIGVVPYGEVLIALAEADDLSGCEILVYPAIPSATALGLRVFHFSEGPGLRRTTGPVVGAIEGRYVTRFVLTAENRNAILMQLSGGKLIGRYLDSTGIPGKAMPGAVIDTCARELGVGMDGALLEPSGVLSAPGVVLQADLDGDGRVETVRII